MFMIKRWIELDAGHRVPYHGSKCRHLHGHRYRVTAVVAAKDLIAESTGRSDAGMVTDFGVLKQVLMKVVHDPFDHMMILWNLDPIWGGINAMAEQHSADYLGIVGVPCMPTAEELARYWGRAVAGMLRLPEGGGLDLHSLEVRETPTSLAIWDAPLFDYE